MSWHGFSMVNTKGDSDSPPGYCGKESRCVKRPLTIQSMHNLYGNVCYERVHLFTVVFLRQAVYHVNTAKQTAGWVFSGKDDLDICHGTRKQIWRRLSYKHSKPTHMNMRVHWVNPVMLLTDGFHFWNMCSWY